MSSLPPPRMPAVVEMRAAVLWSIGLYHVAQSSSHSGYGIRGRHGCRRGRGFSPAGHSEPAADPFGCSVAGLLCVRRTQPLRRARFGRVRLGGLYRRCDPLRARLSRRRRRQAIEPPIMRARTLILIVLALLLAGGTAWLASSYLNSQRQTIVREAEPLKMATPSKSVLVAKADLKRGQILRPEDTTWQVWPEGALDKNYIVLGGPPVPPRTPESFAGTLSRNPITARAPL